jgi:hypothetical protein
MIWNNYKPSLFRINAVSSSYYVPLKTSLQKKAPSHSYLDGAFLKISLLIIGFVVHPLVYLLFCKPCYYLHRVFPGNNSRQPIHSIFHH